MVDISLLGNVGAVPVIIAATQFIKTRFSFAAKRKSDFISGLVALVVCFGWDLYYLPAEELAIVWGGGAIAVSKHLMHLTIVSFATWMSANKLYDFGMGNKKRTAIIDQHVAEKQVLKEKLDHHATELRVRDEQKAEPVKERSSFSEELRAILEKG